MFLPPKLRPSFDTRTILVALLSGLPGSAVAFVFLWGGDVSAKVQWTLSVLILVVWIGCAFVLRNRVTVALQTVANLLAALREGDYSIRARVERADDTMSEVMREVNAFAATLREQRLSEIEATALLRRVMSEIDAAVFAFDGRDRLRLVNPAAESLLGMRSEQILGKEASELGLVELLTGDESAPRDLVFPGGEGRWGIRRAQFRQHGLPHRLVLLLDLSRPLREEELQAWQRLVRVLGHELNNSLAPITSIADSLDRLLDREPKPDDWRDDMRRGLEVISSRAGALSRFLEAYSRLARLPRPSLVPVEVAELIDGVARMEMRRAVEIHPGPSMTIRIDRGQIEQVLINLIHNAVDAVLETGGGVGINWREMGRGVEIAIEDEGPGIANPANLFVPFFTTKPEGSGIGLILSRQIVEAHGGTLTVDNRTDRVGCVAKVRV